MKATTNLSTYTEVRLDEDERFDVVYDKRTIRVDTLTAGDYRQGGKPSVTGHGHVVLKSGGLGQARSKVYVVPEKYLTQAIYDAITQSKRDAFADAYHQDQVR